MSPSLLLRLGSGLGSGLRAGTSSAGYRDLEQSSRQLQRGSMLWKRLGSVFRIGVAPRAAYEAAERDGRPPE